MEKLWLVVELCSLFLSIWNVIGPTGTVSPSTPGLPLAL